MAEPSWPKIRAALGPAERARRGDSAVLIPLVDEPSGPHVLFTVRAADLRQHPGEMSFPGGRIEPEDPSPLDAALRETREEIGLTLTQSEMLGHLADYHTFRDTWVSAFVARVRPDVLAKAPVFSTEVQAILLVPLLQFVTPPAPAPMHEHPAAHPNRIHVCSVKDYHSRSLADEDGTDRFIHYWRLADGHTMWGISADLLSILLARAFGWKSPVTPRRLRTHEDVRP